MTFIDDLRAWEQAKFEQRPWNDLAHVLWFFDHDGGVRPGQFTRNLLNAIQAADSLNKELLACVYPDLVSAFRVAENVEDGLARMAKLVIP